MHMPRVAVRFHDSYFSLDREERYRRTHSIWSTGLNVGPLGSHAALQIDRHLGIPGMLSGIAHHRTRQSTEYGVPSTEYST